MRNTLPARHGEIVARMFGIEAELTTLADIEDLTRSQESHFDELKTEYEKIDTERKIIERSADLDEIRRLGNGESGGSTVTPRSVQPNDRDRIAFGDQHETRARRNIETAQAGGMLGDEAAERADELITTGSSVARGAASRWASVAGDPAYLRAFAHLVADPQRGHLRWTEAERQAFDAVETFRSEERAMSLTDANGGYMVPLTLDPAIILTSDGTTAALRQVARRVTTATDQWQGVTSAGATAEWLAEASESADGSPTLDDEPIPVHKASVWVPFSYEVGMDAVDFTGEVARVMRDAAGNLEAEAFTTGSGSGQPTGIVTALAGTASEVSPATAETFAAADVYALIEALPPRFRANASWLANLSILNLIDQFETTNGSKQFTELGQDRLLRRRVVENSDMDGSFDTGATADNHILAVGDFREFVIVDRIGTTVELVPHLMGANRRPTGQRGFHAWLRTGSNVTTINAFRLLNLATTA